VTGWLIVVTVLVVVSLPVVVLVANRVVRYLRQIVDYADDILEHGVEVTRNLDPIPALVRTRNLVADTREAAMRYAAVLDRLV